MPVEVTNDIRAAMKRAGVELEAAIEALARVDTGRMKAAAHHRVSNDGLGVVAGYSPRQTGFKKFWKQGGFIARWQEFGTRYIRRQPFISPAFRALLPTLLDRIDTAVTQALRRGRSVGG